MAVPADGESNFTGKARQELVKGLVQLYDSLSDDRGAKESRKPVWVSLEAPSGWGKTRVGVELYRSLADRQKDPKYWPSEIIDTAPLLKVVRPLKPKEGRRELPDYLWLGIACSQRNGRPSQVFHEDITQIEPHRPLLDESCRRKASRSDAWRRRIQNGARELVRQAPAEGLGWLMGLTTGSLPVVGSVVVRGGTASLAYARRRSTIRKLLAGQELPSTSKVDETVGYLANISKSGLGLVVLVEDFHDADEILCEFLGKLMEKGGCILILTTTQTDQITNSANWTDQFEHYKDRVYRVNYSEPAPEPPFANDAGLTKLEWNARRFLLCRDYSAVDDGTVTSLLKRYVNPYSIEIFRKDDMGRRDPDNMVLQLEPEDIERMPDTLYNQYSKKWHDLSREERTGLAVAWQIAPENIHPDKKNRDCCWSHPVLVQVMAKLRRDDGDRAIAIEVSEVEDEPHAWVRAMGEDLRTFRDPLHSEIIRDLGQKFLERTLRCRDARRLILEALADVLSNGRDDEATRAHRARTVLALKEADYIDNPDLVTKANMTLDALEEESRESDERDRLHESLDEFDPNEVDISAQTRFEMRRKHATSLQEDLKPKEAMQEFLSLVDDMSQSHDFGPLHRETLQVRLDMAVCQGVVGPHSASVALLEEVIGDMQSVLGPTHFLTLDAEMNLAFALRDPGMYREALHNLILLLGHEHPAVFDAIAGLVYLYSNRQEYDAAMTVCDIQLLHLSQTLGWSHSEARRMRQTRAMLCEFQGRYDEAIEMYRAVLEDIEANPEGTESLEIRSRVVYQLCLNNQLDKALDEAADLVDDATRFLGPDHEVLWEAKQRRIEVLIEAGVDDEAIDASAELLAQVLNSDAADDQKGSIAWNWHTYNLKAAGRHKAAAAAFKEAMKLESTLLDEKDPVRFVLRRDLVDFLWEAGHRDEALAESDELVEEASSELKSGDALFRELVEQQLRLRSWAAE